MATINPNQDYDIIHTLTFSAASGTCPIRLYRGSSSTYTGTVYYRAGTSGDWTSLSVSGTSTTFPVTSTTMQIAHNWNKSGNNYMTPSFQDATNITSIAISQKSFLTGTMWDFFMYYYAYGCSSLTSLDVPDTSGLTSVRNGFMYYYARGCSSLTSLAVPDTSSLTSVGSDFMTYYAYGCSSLTSLDVPDTSGLTSVGSYFMRYYAYGCSSLTSLAVPDTSSLTSVGSYFMQNYASGCSSLTELVLPAVGWFEDNNVDWNVPSGRLGVLKGRVLNSDDLSDWKDLTAEGKTLYTNYIRDPDLVYCEEAIYVADLIRTIIQSQSYNADTKRPITQSQTYQADTFRKVNKAYQYSADTKRATIKEYTFNADTLRKKKGTVWIPLGTFWSLDWDSPDDSLEATVTARDRMELLRKTTYQTSQVLTNKSLYELAEGVLQDAGLSINEYVIDTTLNNIRVPYAWFNPVSHREALRLIAEAGLAVAFQNRDGKIQIESFLITGDEPVLEITEDDYFPPLRAPSRQDQVANEIIVDTQPLRPTSAAEEVYRSNEPITIPANSTQTLTVYYNKTPVIDAIATLDSPPAGVAITEATYYGWGASIKVANSTGTDQQVTLVIQGKPMTVQGKERAIARDEVSITELGILSFEFPANPLVQTLTQAQAIADALLASVKDPRRDIEVDWRGNPALELGDRVTVKGKDYHVIRQEINWQGYLSARLTGRKA